MSHSRISYRKRLSTAALVLWVAALTGAILSPAPAGAAPQYPTPLPDAFYRQPADIADKSPGDVLAVRPMPALPAFPDVTVTLIKFRSTNSEGKPIAATTTLLTPSSHQSNGPLLSYQHIINGLGTQCAVSQELYTSDPNLVIREAPGLNVALARGWSVVLPDHLGPTSAYGAAKLGGQITLDSIRAVQRLPQSNTAESRVAMVGYSGGGMATGWAAALHPSYAPELNIVGAAEGGVPMNLTQMAEGLGYQPHPAFGLAFAAAIGLEREYPDRLPISEQLNAKGLALRNQIANGCTNDILAGGAGLGVRQVASSESLASDPRARGVLNENSLELFSGVPTMPIFEWHAPNDALIPVAAIENTIRRYCAAGTKVDSAQIPSPDHLTTAVLGAPVALNYLDERFRGIPAPSTC
ncbi:lipase family protein [Nocardia sp. 348MFTsu5.1]|uniref:lipase family protein n=1 Tax=Nocardia sp. 348MFTsu5.1 TaxID=1172185 RepID=UPI00039F3C9D|nr:lipase family protein [Nocardia sp. 348MFTsu5.1]